MYGPLAASRGSVPSTSGRSFKEGFHTCRQLDLPWGGPRRQLVASRRHGSAYHGLPHVGPGHGAVQRFRTGAVGDEITAVAEQDVYKPPLFKPFISKTHVADQLKKFEMRTPAAGGELVIRALTHQFVPATADLLAESFSDAMGYMPIYRRYLRNHIGQYLTAHVDLLPKTVILIALLHPSTATEPSNGQPDIPNYDLPSMDHDRARGNASAQSGSEAHATGVEGRTEGGEIGAEGGAASGISANQGRLVGTVELSFAAATRTRFLTLNAPLECAYLCNMAVDPAYQRRGYGMFLLDACEDVTRMVGEKEIFLHLRLKDRPAAALYKRGGFTVAAEDNPLILLLGQDRRYLMRKDVQ